MLKKTAFLVAILALVFAGTAWAGSPPSHGGYSAGWGMNPTNWDNHTGGFSAWGLYDPNAPSLGGDAWVIGYYGSMDPIYITYAPITLELWIEMYCLQTYEFTSYQWHRLGDAAEDIYFTIQGRCQSNNGQWVSLMKDADNLDELTFRHNIFGSATPGPDVRPIIPIDWQARYGKGLIYGNSVLWGWAAVNPDPDDIDIGPIPSCDHWFQFRGHFHLNYHEADGYYSLTMAGCPAPVM